MKKEPEKCGRGAPEQPLPEGPRSPPVGRPTDQLVSLNACAKYLGCDSPDSVHQYIRERRLIAWQDASHQWIVPLNQLGPDGTLIPQLPRIMDYFSEANEAWLWLTQPNRSTHRERPLDRAHAGYVDEVLYAAAMYDEGAFT